MSFDDDAVDEIGCRPPPHPDDRLWRHPSEMTTAASGPAHLRKTRALPWGAIAAVGTASVVLAGALALVVGVRLPAKESDEADLASSSVIDNPTTSAMSISPQNAQIEDATEKRLLADRLGINARNDPEGAGVAVTSVDPDGPAAGELDADVVIVEVNGQPVADVATMAVELGDLEQVQEIELTYRGPSGEQTVIIATTLPQ